MSAPKISQEYIHSHIYSCLKWCGSRLGVVGQRGVSYRYGLGIKVSEEDVGDQ